MAFGDWIDRFAVWDGFHPDLETLLIYGAGIAVYTALVFAFYQNISRRDPLHSHDRPGWWGKVVHTAETVFTFPLVSTGYFIVLSLALFLMAKPATSTAQILLLSMAAVLGVRVTAHLSERMSNDIAKLLPLSLLAVVLVDPGYLNLGSTAGRITDAIWMAPVLFQYFVLFIVVEALMRGLRGLSPAFVALWQKEERHRRVSKKAMLRAVEHDHKAHAPKFHEHGPRAKGEAWLELDEGHMGKPGRNQGAGPAFMKEHKQAVRHAPHAAAAPHHARSGPGGKGGDFTRMA